MAPTNTELTDFRRIVTGHDEDGQAVILSDAPPTRVQQIGGPGGPTFVEVWNTRQTPVLIDRSSGEPAENGLVLAPPKGGTRIRVIDFPPEGETIRKLTESEAAEKFGEMGGAEACAVEGRRAASVDASYANPGLRNRPGGRVDAGDGSRGDGGASR